MSVSNYKYIIYTDGSANSQITGASACIVQDLQSLKNYYLVASLGQSTNNQAEIFASLIGYTFLSVLDDACKLKSEQGALPIQLVSDSQYVLQSSSEYVYKWKETGHLSNPYSSIKNKDFWRMFLFLTKDIAIYPCHVKGHYGHVENTKCDLVANHIRKIKASIQGPNEHSFVEMSYGRKIDDVDYWFYIDCEDIAQSLAADEGLYATHVETLMSKLRHYFQHNTPMESIFSLEDRVIDQMYQKLIEVLKIPRQHQVTCDKIEELSSKVNSLVKERD